MNKFLQSVENVFKGGVKAFGIYPASMLCAIILAVLSSITIENNNYYHHFYDSLRLALAFGLVFGMAVSAAAKKIGNKILFWIFNIIDIASALLVFLLLYYGFKDITPLALSRVFAAIAISFLLFLLIPSFKSSKIDYNKMSFMTLKSLFIALIYFLVIMLGLYFIAFAVQSLLYEDLSYKIYQHIAIYSGLLGFAFFLGYFPLFNKEEDDEHFDTAVKHPRFIEILFQYIVIPLLTVLTVVVLAWIAKNLATGFRPQFEQLSGIFAGYSLFGILIYILTSHYTSPIARWFRRIFPIVTILFSGFEGYNIIKRVFESGFKFSEYSFSVIWIFAVISSILFLFIPVVKNRLTAYLAAILIALTVLPYTGYMDVPVFSQTMRLQNVLVKNEMLADNKITPKPSISSEDKKTISDAVLFIATSEDAKLPEWLKSAGNLRNNFTKIFGFESTGYSGEPINFKESIYLHMPDGYVNISDYNYAIKYQYSFNSSSVTIKGENGEYIIKYDSGDGRIPSVSIEKQSKKLLEISTADFEKYIDNLETKYENSTSQGGKLSNATNSEDMIYKAEGEGVKIMLVFNSINIYYSNGNNRDISFALESIYLAE